GVHHSARVPTPPLPLFPGALHTLLFQLDYMQRQGARRWSNRGLNLQIEALYWPAQNRQVARPDPIVLVILAESKRDILVVHVGDKSGTSDPDSGESDRNVLVVSVQRPDGQLLG